MLQSDTYEDLLLGGLDDQYASACRAWIDESKRHYGVNTDLEAIQRYSDSEILLRIVRASRLFSTSALEKCGFIGLPTPRFQVLAIERDGHQLVAIHEGFLHLVSFLNEASLLHWALWEHLTHLSHDVAKNLEECLRRDTLRIARRFLRKPFRLPSFLSQFSEQMKGKMENEVVAMMAFAIHHELAHHEAGHDRRAEPLRHQSLLDEPLNYFKSQEFEADRQAIQAVRSNMDLYVAGAALLLTHLALLDSVSLDLKSTHPLAVNRMHHLEDALPSWTSDQTRTLFKETVQYRAAYHQHRRKRGLPLGFELYSEAAAGSVIRELTDIADVLLKGERLVSEYGGSPVYPSRRRKPGAAHRTD